MLVFDASALIAVLDAKHDHHAHWADRFAGGIDRGDVWVTSFALCSVDLWLGNSREAMRSSFWRNALDGLHIIWVGPSTVEYALRDRRPGESVEASIARVVSTQLGAELASDRTSSEEQSRTGGVADFSDEGIDVDKHGLSET